MSGSARRWPVGTTLLAAAAAVLAVLSVQVPAAADGLPRVEALEERIEALAEAAGVNAAVVGIDRGGSRLFAAVGESLPGEPASPAMTARIGAMSITALATILLQLAEEGVLSLDDPIEDWRPGLPAGDRITLRMLASATSGYADYVDDPAFLEAFYGDVFRTWTRDELLAIALERGLQHPPGEGFTYSHAGFVILAEALEAAAGVPLERLVGERIIAPLGLRRTFYRAPGDAGLTPPVLAAYTTERGLFEYSTHWSPSWTLATGFLSSDMPDLLRLARAFGTGALLSEASFSAMLAPRTAGMAGMTADSYYGLGIAWRDGFVTQTFSFGGYAGTVGHRPADDLTIAVVITQGRTSDPDVNHATGIMAALGELLAR